jgi:hypothetical protein
VAGQVPSLVEVESLSGVQRGHRVGADRQLGHAGPAGVDRHPGLVLLRLQPDGGCLDPHRQVLADQRDGTAVRGQAARHREDPAVVVPQPETGRQHPWVRVVELHPERAAPLTDGQRGVQAPVPHPEVVEQPQRLAGVVAQLGMVALGLQLGDHDHRQDHLVLVEAEHRPRVGQEHRGVQDERASAPAAAGTGR